MNRTELRRVVLENADKFYVYVMYRPDTGFPFYVGKGRKKRALMHEMEIDAEWGVNTHKHNIMGMLRRKGLRVDYRIASFFDDENAAFGYEKLLIDILGREVCGGMLVNLIEGGSGLNGLSDDSVSKRVASWRAAYDAKPEWQEQMRERGRKLAANPVTQARRLEAQKEFLHSDQNINHLKKLAADPGCRAKLVAGVKAFHADPVKSAEFAEGCRVRSSTPEKKKEMSDRMRAHFSNPANKAAHTEKRKAYFTEDPSRIRKAVAKMHEACRTPEAIAAQKESRTRTWVLQKEVVKRCEQLIAGHDELASEVMLDKRSGLPKWLEFEKHLLAKIL